ncbi:response regulator [Fictibacillus fluitans]|uniref:Response regulator n=1 Tax=Fictibacillus fluitans TaxID=3058422 RepID=A0ABT8HQT4_9BACL|nr:response regulator [Fictibacillus sp. NE201]MDN4523123.1 response regulator [Fictibacillus sp. NE201]
MKAIIVDDESIERKALRKIIESRFPELEIAAEAANGKMAVELAEKHQPELMTVDIKMPGMNGIEAIRKIHKKLPQTQFIMVTAYESFDYAKEAMKLGVREYLLKPSTQDETTAAIHRVCRSISEEKERELLFSESTSVVLENILLKILQHELQDEPSQMLQRLYPRMVNAYITVMEGEGDLPADHIKGRLNELSSSPFIAVPHGNQLVVLFISEKHDPSDDALLLAKRLLSASFEKWRIGIGAPYPQVNKVRRSYEEALYTVMHLKRQDSLRYALFSDADPAREIPFGDIISAIFHNQPFEASAMLGMIINQERTADLYIELKEQLIHESIDTAHLQFPQTTQAWEELIHGLCQMIQDVRRAKDPVALARKYIDEHSHEPLSLEQIAEMVGLSPTYFTKLFKEETNVTFIEFLTDVRLNKAVTLLNKNQYSLKEICFMVGYKDPNYFSRVFKKQFLLSPKQYIREKALSQYRKGWAAP